MESNSLSLLAAFVEADDVSGIHITPVISTSVYYFMFVKYHLLPAKYVAFHE
jgi:hypothetical protein